MRILIAFLLLLGGGAVLFYETHVDRAETHRIISVSSDAPAGGTDDASPITNESDDFAKLKSGGSDLSDPLEAGDAPAAAPSVTLPAQGGSEKAESPKTPSATSPTTTIKPSSVAPQLSSVTFLLERNEARRASAKLATVQKALETAQKERDHLSGRVFDLSSEASKLRAAAQAKADEVAGVRRHLAEQTEQASSAAAGRADLERQITVLKGQSNDTAATARDAQARLARSEARAGELQTKLAELEATSQETVARARDELSQNSANAGRYSAGMNVLAEKLRLAEAKVRDLTGDRDSAIARAARGAVQQRLAATGLWAARQALATANARVAAQQRSIAFAADRVRQLADGIEALRTRSAAAGARIDKMKGALSRATEAGDALQARLNGLGSQRESAEAALTDARAENARLKNQLDSVTSQSEGKLADMKQTNAALTARAERLPQLARDLAARDAAAQRQIASMTDTTKKLRLAEAKVRDLTAERDIASRRVARTTVQQHLTASGLAAAELALAGAAERTAAAQRAAGLASDHARQLADGNEDLRKRADAADAQVDEMKSALGRAQEAAAGTKARLEGFGSERDGMDAAVTENVRLAARLDAVVTQSKTQLADLRQRNKKLAGEAAQVPQLARAVDDAKQQLGEREKAIAALQSQNTDEIVRLNAAKKSSEDQLAQVEEERRARKVVGDDRAQKLEGTLASVQAELAKAIREKASSNDARQWAERTLADVQAKLQVEHRQAALLAKQSAASDAQLTPSAPKPAAPQSDPARKSEQPQSSTARKPMPTPPAFALGGGTSADLALPDTVAAHVLLRYAHDKTRSQAHAQTLQTKLRGLGVDVTDSAANGPGKPGDSVTYFYAQDRSIADQVAQQIEAPAPVRSRSASPRAPRPGTIEIMVGG